MSGITLRLGLLASLGGMLFTVEFAQAQSVIYVDDDAPLGGDGTSWETAFRYLQDGLAAATAGDEVRVAGGTYKPDQDEAGNVTPGDGRAAFQLVSGVALYGGYRGCPTSDCSMSDPGERDIETYETILSGDLNGDDGPEFANYNDNSLVVLRSSGADETGIVGGVVITGAHGYGILNIAGAPKIQRCVFYRNKTELTGSGLYNMDGSPTLIDCAFISNRARAAGGMYNRNGHSLLVRCVFADNEAFGYGFRAGGGMVNASGSRPILVGCVFRRNSTGGMGGGMYNDSSAPTLINCVFSGNSGREGGAIANRRSAPHLLNCTLALNEARRAGGILNFGFSAPGFANCILWGNIGGDEPVEAAQIMNIDDYGINTPYVDFSCVQGWTGMLGGIGNFGHDPRLVDAGGPDGIPGTEDDDVRLLRGSPCIDAGDNESVSAEVTTDLDGKPRFVDDPETPDSGNGIPPIVDMGAYEFQEMLTAYLDIRPGSCPNPINPRSKGVLPVAIVGSDAFDVTQIDTDSIIVARADGAGGEVAPLAGPSGPSPVIEDVTSPLDGHACDCQESGGDGIDDLMLKFSTPELARELELGSSAHGGNIELILRGVLLDGIAFEATDCVVVRGGKAIDRLRDKRRSR